MQQDLNNIYKSNRLISAKEGDMKQVNMFETGSKLSSLVKSLVTHNEDRIILAGQ